MNEIMVNIRRTMLLCGFFVLAVLTFVVLPQQPQLPSSSDTNVALAKTPVKLTLQAAEINSVATRAMMLAATRAGKRIVAVGDYGTVLLSDDNGTSFRQAKSVPAQVTLSAVSFIDSKMGWAVGQWGVVLRTSDGGETWELQRSDTSIDQPLFSVYFKDKGHGWAVGLWSLALETTDGGKTWTTVKIPAPPGGTQKADKNLFKIVANQKGTLFIASEQGLVLRSNDGGVNWSYLSTGYNGSFWTGIALKDGSILVGGLRGTIYRSTDDGQSWHASTSMTKNSVTDIAELDGKVFATALDGVFLQSSDHGVTFAASEVEGRAPLTAFVIAENNHIVMFSKFGIVASVQENVSDKEKK